MFLTLLAATFAIAFGVSFIIARVFRTPMTRILDRILADEIADAWIRYLLFAVYVVGISSGVRPWDLQRYIDPQPGLEAGAAPLTLTLDHWVLEIYRTVIGTLQGVAWMLLVFFIVSLIVFAVIRIFEMRRGGHNDERPPRSPDAREEADRG